MELVTKEQGNVTNLTGAGDSAAGGEDAAPVRSPAIDPIPNDPLREPHPAEPGVKSDGTASPLENPAAPG
jgi:hypothetical protein